jgi:glycosyltransferase involved in cell wall biosynthesis
MSDAVHQFVPTLEPGAVASHTRFARDLLRAAGYDSEIYAQFINGDAANWGAREYKQFARDQRRAKTKTTIIYQLAIGSNVADYVAKRSEQLIVNYHNLTPGRFLGGWDASAAFGVTWGRNQLPMLAARSDLAIAVSRYNERDLQDAGFTNTTVVPFFYDATEIPKEGDPATRDRLAAERAGSGHEWLFVGRFTPNKCQHDLVKAFVAYQRVYDPDARLRMVGGGLDSRYGRALVDFIAALHLESAIECKASATPAELAAYYQSADVFVITSEHEGFCVPLLEAMHHDIPVVAFDAGAVAETVGDAGIVLDSKSPELIAGAVARVMRDANVRGALVAAGRQRLDAFDLESAGKAFVAAVESVTGR